MDYDVYLKKMRENRNALLEYLDDEQNTDEVFEKINKYFNDQKIFEDPHFFKETITLISCIANNHHRNEHFFDKIDRILSSFKSEILKNFSNYEIYTIFRKNHRIVFFLLNEKVIKPDVSIFANLTSKMYKKAYYPHYFSPEFKALFEKKEHLRQELSQRMAKLPPRGEHIERNSEKFEKKRKVAENDEKVCQLIREDSIEKFEMYVNKVNLSLSSTVGSSIFETNAFLINKNPTLIQYAAFFGSLKIFNYLIENGIELDPSLWLYAIHSRNLDLIHILENHKILPEDETYKECLLESIRCHHSNMTKYIMNDILKNQNIDKKAIVAQSIRYNNYEYFPDQMSVDFDIFYDLCKYDYYSIVKLFLNENLNLNQTKILIQFFE